MIRRSFFLIQGAFVCGLALSAANAYEVETHEDLSEAAARQSRFSEYLPAIGLTTIGR
jgi:hypothetical protein